MSKNILMGFLENMRMFFHRYLLGRDLKHASVKQSRKAGNFQQAKIIGLLFNATNLDHRKEVLAYASQLRNKGKKVLMLAFIDNKTETSDFTFEYFNRKSIDWAYRPKGEKVREFLTHKFDVLINLETVSDIFLEYISVLSQASLKVGPITENTGAYDFMLDRPANITLKQFTGQMESMLMKTSVQYDNVSV